MIEQIKCLKIADLDKKTKSELRDIYKALIDDVENLYTSYESNKDKANKQYLKENIDNHKNAIHVFSNVITAFHNKFTDEIDKPQKEILRGYIENLQIHLTRLQQQYNQSIYRKQQCDNKFSKHIAYIALGTTVVLSILSILCSYFDWKYKTIDYDIKIECLSDSIKNLNDKIEQQNEIIEKYAPIQDNDTAISKIK